MPYVCVFLGVTCLVFAFRLQDVSSLSSGVLFLIGILAILPARLKTFPKILHRSCAMLATLLCFVSFGMFFSYAPELNAVWYLSGFTTPFVGLVIGGFTSMTIVSENSCCLKVDQEILEIPECVEVFSNVKRRIQEIRAT